MPTKVFLDLETLPPDRDDMSVREKVEGCTEEEFRRLALDGEYGRLLCVGLIVERDGEIIHRGVLGRDRNTGEFHLDEVRTLRAFWRLLKEFDQRRDLLIGFNILDFDLVFLRQRSYIKRVKPSFDVCMARFRSAPVYDVMWEFACWRHRHSLDALAKVLGLASSKQSGVDGSAVYNLLLAGRHQEIADYCMRDVELTRTIYARMNFLDQQ